MKLGEGAFGAVYKVISQQHKPNLANDLVVIANRIL
jgi:hypothetical protein